MMFYATLKATCDDYVIIAEEMRYAIACDIAADISRHAFSRQRHYATPYFATRL